MQLYNGRPTDLSGRLDKEKRVYDLLDELGIEYARVDHPAAETMEACEEIEKVLGGEICKNLCRRGIHAGIFGYYARFRFRYGAYER